MSTTTPSKMSSSASSSTSSSPTLIPIEVDVIDLDELDNTLEKLKCYFRKLLLFSMENTGGGDNDNSNLVTDVDQCDQFHRGRQRFHQYNLLKEIEQLFDNINGEYIWKYVLRQYYRITRTFDNLYDDYRFQLSVVNLMAKYINYQCEKFNKFRTQKITEDIEDALKNTWTMMNSLILNNFCYKSLVLLKTDMCENNAFFLVPFAQRLFYEMLKKLTTINNNNNNNSNNNNNTTTNNNTTQRNKNILLNSGILLLNRIRQTLMIDDKDVRWFYSKFLAVLNELEKLRRSLYSENGLDLLMLPSMEFKNKSIKDLCEMIGVTSTDKIDLFFDNCTVSLNKNGLQEPIKFTEISTININKDEIINIDDDDDNEDDKTERAKENEENTTTNSSINETSNLVVSLLNDNCDLDLVNCCPISNCTKKPTTPSIVAAIENPSVSNIIPINSNKNNKNNSHNNNKFKSKNSLINNQTNINSGNSSSSNSNNVLNVINNSPNNINSIIINDDDDDDNKSHIKIPSEQIRLDSTTPLVDTHLCDITKKINSTEIITDPINCAYGTTSGFNNKNINNNNNNKCKNSSLSEMNKIDSSLSIKLQTKLNKSPTPKVLVVGTIKPITLPTNNLPHRLPIPIATVKPSRLMEFNDKDSQSLGISPLIVPPSSSSKVPCTTLVTKSTLSNHTQMITTLSSSLSLSSLSSSSSSSTSPSSSSSPPSPTSPPSSLAIAAITTVTETTAISSAPTTTAAMTTTTTTTTTITNVARTISTTTVASTISTITPATTTITTNTVKPPPLKLIEPNVPKDNTKTHSNPQKMSLQPQPELLSPKVLTPPPSTSSVTPPTPLTPPTPTLTPPPPTPPQQSQSQSSIKRPISTNEKKLTQSELPTSNKKTTNPIPSKSTSTISVKSLSSMTSSSTNESSKLTLSTVQNDYISSTTVELVPIKNTNETTASTSQPGQSPTSRTPQSTAVIEPDSSFSFHGASPPSTSSSICESSFNDESTTSEYYISPIISRPNSQQQQLPQTIQLSPRITTPPPTPSLPIPLVQASASLPSSSPPPPPPPPSLPPSPSPSPPVAVAVITTPPQLLTATQNKENDINKVDSNNLATVDTTELSRQLPPQPLTVDIVNQPESLLPQSEVDKSTISNQKDIEVKNIENEKEQEINILSKSESELKTSPKQKTPNVESIVVVNNNQRHHSFTEFELCLEPVSVEPSNYEDISSGEECFIDGKEENSYDNDIDDDDDSDDDDYDEDELKNVDDDDDDNNNDDADFDDDDNESSDLSNATINNEVTKLTTEKMIKTDSLHLNKKDDLNGRDTPLVDEIEGNSRPLTITCDLSVLKTVIDPLTAPSLKLSKKPNIIPLKNDLKTKNTLNFITPSEKIIIENKTPPISLKKPAMDSDNKLTKTNKTDLNINKSESEADIVKEVKSISKSCNVSGKNDVDVKPVTAKSIDSIKTVTDSPKLAISKCLDSQLSKSITSNIKNPQTEKRDSKTSEISSKSLTKSSFTALISCNSEKQLPSNIHKSIILNSVEQKTAKPVQSNEENSTTLKTTNIANTLNSQINKPNPEVSKINKVVSNSKTTSNVTVKKPNISKQMPLSAATINSSDLKQKTVISSSSHKPSGTMKSTSNSSTSSNINKLESTKSSIINSSSSNSPKLETTKSVSTSSTSSSTAHKSKPTKPSTSSSSSTSTKSSPNLDQHKIKIEKTESISLKTSAEVIKTQTNISSTPSSSASSSSSDLNKLKKLHKQHSSSSSSSDTEKSKHRHSKSQESNTSSRSSSTDSEKRDRDKKHHRSSSSSSRSSSTNSDKSKITQKNSSNSSSRDSSSCSSSSHSGKTKHHSKPIDEVSKPSKHQSNSSTVKTTKTSASEKISHKDHKNHCKTDRLTVPKNDSIKEKDNKVKQHRKEDATKNSLSSSAATTTSTTTTTTTINTNPKDSTKSSNIKSNSTDRSSQNVENNKLNTKQKDEKKRKSNDREIVIDSLSKKPKLHKETSLEKKSELLESESPKSLNAECTALVNPSINKKETPKSSSDGESKKSNASTIKKDNCLLPLNKFTIKDKKSNNKSSDTANNNPSMIKESETGDSTTKPTKMTNSTDLEIETKKLAKKMNDNDEFANKQPLTADTSEKKSTLTTEKNKSSIKKDFNLETKKSHNLFNDIDSIDKSNTVTPTRKMNNSPVTVVAGNSIKTVNAIESTKVLNSNAAVTTSATTTTVLSELDIKTNKSIEKEKNVCNTLTDVVSNNSIDTKSSSSCNKTESIKPDPIINNAPISKKLDKEKIIETNKSNVLINKKISFDLTLTNIESITTAPTQSVQNDDTISQNSSNKSKKLHKICSKVLRRGLIKPKPKINGESDQKCLIKPSVLISVVPNSCSDTIPFLKTEVNSNFPYSPKYDTHHQPVVAKNRLSAPPATPPPPPSSSFPLPVPPQPEPVNIFAAASNRKSPLLLPSINSLQPPAIFSENKAEENVSKKLLKKETSINTLDYKQPIFGSTSIVQDKNVKPLKSEQIIKSEAIDKKADSIVETPNGTIKPKLLEIKSYQRIENSSQYDLSSGKRPKVSIKQLPKEFSNQLLSIKTKPTNFINNQATPSNVNVVDTPPLPATKHSIKENSRELIENKNELHQQQQQQQDSTIPTVTIQQLATETMPPLQSILKKHINENQQRQKRSISFVDDHSNVEKRTKLESTVKTDESPLLSPILSLQQKIIESTEPIKSNVVNNTAESTIEDTNKITVEETQEKTTTSSLKQVRKRKCSVESQIVDQSSIFGNPKIRNLRSNSFFIPPPVQEPPQQQNQQYKPPQSTSPPPSQITSDHEQKNSMNQSHHRSIQAEVARESMTVAAGVKTVARNLFQPTPKKIVYSPKVVDLKLSPQRGPINNKHIESILEDRLTDDDKKLSSFFTAPIRQNTTHVQINSLPPSPLIALKNQSSLKSSMNANVGQTASHAPRTPPSSSPPSPKTPPHPLTPPPPPSIQSKSPSPPSVQSKPQPPPSVQSKSPPPTSIQSKPLPRPPVQSKPPPPTSIQSKPPPPPSVQSNPPPVQSKPTPTQSSPKLEPKTSKLDLLTAVVAEISEFQNNQNRTFSTTNSTLSTNSTVASLSVTLASSSTLSSTISSYSSSSLSSASSTSSFSSLSSASSSSSSSSLSSTSTSCSSSSLVLTSSSYMSSTSSPYMSSSSSILSSKLPFRDDKDMLEAELLMSIQNETVKPSVILPSQSATIESLLIVNLPPLPQSTSSKVPSGLKLSLPPSQSQSPSPSSSSSRSSSPSPPTSPPPFISSSLLPLPTLPSTRTPSPVKLILPPRNVTPPPLKTPIIPVIPSSSPLSTLVSLRNVQISTRPASPLPSLKTPPIEDILPIHSSSTLIPTPLPPILPINEKPSSSLLKSPPSPHVKDEDFMSVQSIDFDIMLKYNNDEPNNDNDETPIVPIVPTNHKSSSTELIYNELPILEAATNCPPTYDFNEPVSYDDLSFPDFEVCGNIMGLGEEFINEKLITDDGINGSSNYQALTTTMTTTMTMTSQQQHTPNISTMTINCSNNNNNINNHDYTSKASTNTVSVSCHQSHLDSVISSSCGDHHSVLNSNGLYNQPPMSSQLLPPVTSSNLSPPILIGGNIVTGIPSCTQNQNNEINNSNNNNIATFSVAPIEFKTSLTTTTSTPLMMLTSTPASISSSMSNHTTRTNVISAGTMPPTTLLNPQINQLTDNNNSTNSNINNGGSGGSKTEWSSYLIDFETPYFIRQPTCKRRYNPNPRNSGNGGSGSGSDSANTSNSCNVSSSNTSSTYNNNSSTSSSSSNNNNNSINRNNSATATSVSNSNCNTPIKQVNFPNNILVLPYPNEQTTGNQIHTMKLLNNNNNNRQNKKQSKQISMPCLTGNDANSGGIGGVSNSVIPNSGGGGSVGSGINGNCNNIRP